jgi:hypothetical protein
VKFEPRADRRPSGKITARRLATPRPRRVLRTQPPVGVCLDCPEGIFNALAMQSAWTHLKMAIFYRSDKGPRDIDAGKLPSWLRRWCVMRLNANYVNSDHLLAVRSILHPTDLSEVSGLAFAHALAISLATYSDSFHHIRCTRIC